MRLLAGVVVVLALASSCGDNGRRPMDAAITDADPRELVRLTYIPPLPDHQRDGLAVIFQAADSTVLLATRTTASGEANAVVGADTYVTLIAPVDPLTNRQTVWTYEGVQPGDELVLDTSIQPSTTRFPIRLVTPPSTNAAYYQMVTPCDTQQIDGGASAGVQLRDCMVGSADILVLTYDALEHTEADLAGYMLKLDVPVASGATVTFPGPYVPIAPSTVTVSNLPSATPLAMTQFLVGSEEPIYGQFREPAVTAGVATAAFRMPLPPEARLLTDLRLAAGSRIVRWGPSSEPTSIDVADYELPPATEPPRFEPTTRRVTWTEARGTNTPNAVLATLTATDVAIDWTMFSRRSAPEVQFPVIPSSELEATLTFQVAELTSLEIRADLDRVRQRVLGRSRGRSFPITGGSGSVGARQHVP